MRVVIRSWAAWAPGIETPDQWLAWSQAPRAVGSAETAKAAFIPAMLRRRCTPLTRTMLTAAFGAVSSEEQAASVRTVFASRHGSINESIAMLKNVALEQKLSPSMFTHTVHNAQAALFSIAAGNREASSALAAQEETFETGFLEALTHLDREPGRPVLFVTGDVPLADDFAPLVDEPDAAYAVGLLLALDGEGSEVDFEIAPGNDDENRNGHAASVAFERGWPNGLEFLRWLLRSEAQLRLPGRRRGWLWRRAQG